MSFQGFSPNTISFLSDLKANNNREWFAEHKASYDVDVKQPATEFAAELQRVFLKLTGMEHTAKIFRVHRDVRFSKDKTPYNSHLHIGFTPQCDATSPPMWFFGVDPEKLTVGCGIFGFDKAMLDRFRVHIASNKGEDFSKLAAQLVQSGFRIAEPELKRVPSPYDKDHERGDLLRRKGLAVWYDFDKPRTIEAPDIVRQCEDALIQAKPLFDHLMHI